MTSHPTCRAWEYGDQATPAEKGPAEVSETSGERVHKVGGGGRVGYLVSCDEYDHRGREERRDEAKRAH